MAARKRHIGALALVFLLLGICGIGLAQVDIGLPGTVRETAGDTINFGGVPKGQTGTASYTFKVLETSETSVTATIQPPGPPFGLQDAPGGSFTLAPGQSITFTVTFTPPAVRSYTGSFKITAQGGYPVQTTTTIVNLTGQGVAGGESPPPGETSPPGETPATTGITLPFTLPLPTTETPTGAVPGTTDEEGKFTVSLSPTTTVAGRLTLCENGQPLVNQPFQLAKTDEGFSLFASGYEEKTVTQFSRFSIMGLESYDLGDVCLETAPEEIAKPATGLETEKTGECPCCSIVVEARMCCNPKDQYVETDTIYEPQLVRIRAAYCEPSEELGDVDLTSLPLTNTGGVLVNPGLARSGASMADLGRIGITSISLNGKSLFAGDGEFEKMVYAGPLEPGKYTVHATIGRLDGEECVCEKTFEVLSCPEVDAKLERTLDPEDGCGAVRVTYNLNWPKGMPDIREIFLGYSDAHYLDRQDSLSFTDTVKPLNACDPRHVEPKVLVDTCNCCSYEIGAEPFNVFPTFRMTDDCICLRLVPNADGTIATQLVFKWKSPTSEPPGCILCKNYELLVYWGDGTISDGNDVVGLSPGQPNEYTVTHQYDTSPEWVDQRPPVDITVKIGSPCGTLEKKLTGHCEIPSDLIAEHDLTTFIEKAKGVDSMRDLVDLIRGLNGVFDSVATSRRASAGERETRICHVLLDVGMKGIGIAEYRDLDGIIAALGEQIAGGVFGNLYLSGADLADRSWKFMHSEDPSDPLYNAAKLVYIPGDNPYFAITLMYGTCDDCPIQPQYHLESVLNDVQARRQIRKVEKELKNPSEPSSHTSVSQTIDITLQIGLCCPPDMCEEATQ